MRLSGLEPRPGEAFGPYVVETRIAEGGMASLWRARHGAEPAPVALKTMLPHVARKPDCTRMFLREAMLGMRLRHPNLVPVHDVGVIGDRHFIEMAFVEGKNLRELLRSRPLPLPMTLAVFSGVFDGLAFLHDFPGEGTEGAGLVHRDISPENLLLGADGHVRLLDLGVASSDLGGGPSALQGKLHYMAPEVFEGAPPDATRDVYAAGVTLFEVLTGHRPYSGTTERALRAEVRAGRRPSATNFRPDLPPELDGLIDLALDPDPRRRPDAATLGGQVRSLLNRLDPRSPEAVAAAELAGWRHEEDRPRARPAPDLFAVPGRTAPPPDRGTDRGVPNQGPINQGPMNQGLTNQGHPGLDPLDPDERSIHDPGLSVFTLYERPRPARRTSTVWDLQRTGRFEPTHMSEPQMSPQARELFERGLMYRRRGDPRSALEAWEMAARIDPSSRVLATNVRRMREKLRR